jgi:outer membrane protein assembly factor BamB
VNALKSCAVAALVALSALGGCGTTAAFGLTGHDNDPKLLGAALQRRQLPAKAGPIGGTPPRAYMVVAGKPKKLVAFDLESAKPVWTVDAEIGSRVAIGNGFVVALEGTELVARDAASGAVKWKHQPIGTFLGVTADAKRAYFVNRIDQGKSATWYLNGLDGASGALVWSADASGQLGAPVAQGGLVLSPFLTQWLSIVDAETGAPLTRIRATEQQISFVRATSDAAWFGSTEGVFRLDERAASGVRAESTYGAVTLPTQLAEASYGPDAYDAVQAGYTAHDRRRILWRAAPGGDGALAFTDGIVGVHYFRFIFGYGIDGTLKWAYSNPRVELVASDHLGAVIAAVSGAGDVIALDPTTGTLRHKIALPDMGGRIIGATFDADGWQPSDDGAKPVETVAALVAIARDRDARFDKVKELAVNSLAQLSGPNVTKDLLGILADDRAPQRLKDAVVDVLIKRKDPTGLAAMAQVLAAERTDFIDNVTARNVGAVARVMASLKDTKLDDFDRAAAVIALVDHLNSPDTEAADLVQVVRALGAIGAADGAAALRTHVLVYRDHADLVANADWHKAVVDALLGTGTATDRELVRFIAEDPRTGAELAAYAKTAVAAGDK